MPDAGWKAFERRIAKYFPDGRRRGPDYRGHGTTGKTDVISPGWSIECKLYGKPTFQIMLDAALQAETNRPEPDDIPIAIVKKKGIQDANSFTVFVWSTFMDYFNPRVRGTGWGMAYLPSRRPTYADIIKTIDDAEQWSITAGAIPVAKIEKYGTDDKIAIMRLSSFSQHFI